ncbi:MAG TPA: hypothetical protein VN884_05680 [Candidatus Sulfotelmatobacter sp.]|nr:hypothetical protein [Candidatus Sulfotelmatobacter sp.]
MKLVMAVLSLLACATVACAQNPDPSKWMCRNLTDSGGFAYQGESIFGTQACRLIPQAAPAASVAPAAVQQAPTMATVTNSVTAPVVSAPSSAPAAVSTSTEIPTTVSDGKTRVFVTDSQSWETRGGSSAGGNRNGWGGSSWMAGGARPQTAEIIKTLNARCPELTVTNNLQKADFVLTLDHEGGKGLLAHRNKVAVFNRDGDDVFSASTRELGNSVKDACAAMLNSKK